MGVRLLVDQKSAEAVMYCSTTGAAFGPVFEDEKGARGFMAWLGRDPRKFTAIDLMRLYDGWRTHKAGVHPREVTHGS